MPDVFISPLKFFHLFLVFNYAITINFVLIILLAISSTTCLVWKMSEKCPSQMTSLVLRL